MPETLYRIKPLSWKGETDWFTAKTVFSTLHVYSVNGYWHFDIVGGDGMAHERKADSFEAATQLAESWYRSKLLIALEAVQHG